MRKIFSVALLAGLLMNAGDANAVLVTNGPLPITERVTVQPIIVSHTTDGSAEYFGNATQQGIIEGLIDNIWAQAGIDIDFLPSNPWTNDFAYGDPSNPTVVRPTSDLNTIVNEGDLAGVENADPLVVNMYFVNIVPGFEFTSENTANGLAFVGGNGITQFVGMNLLSFTGGQEVIAGVVAHELGHNLGLPHIVEAENLMQSGGSANQGERLNGAQISTALMSNLSQPIPVPEPSFVAALMFASGAIAVRRRRRTQAVAA